MVSLRDAERSQEVRPCHSVAGLWRMAHVPVQVPKLLVHGVVNQHRKETVAGWPKPKWEADEVLLRKLLAAGTLAAISSTCLQAHP